MEHCKISKLSNDSTVSKFVIKKNGLKQMIYQVVNILLTEICSLKLRY